jgi:pimeloyl-ACP methyl ester carboxylesterase
MVRPAQSDGGFAALDIAAHNPDCLSRLVCISGVVHGKARGAVGLMRWVAHQGGVGRAIWKGMMKTYRIPRRYPNFWRVACASRRAFDAYPQQRLLGFF